MSDQKDPVLQEAEKALQLTHKLIEEYVAWKKKIVYHNYNTMYGDLLDFVNFRIETADSCLLLIDKQHIADAIGLCRSLFENYLLMTLMCRGYKYFQLQDLSSLSEADFIEHFKKQEEELKQLQAENKTTCLAVMKYKRAKRNLMYVFEGLKNDSDPNFVIPIHFFEFKEFSPEIMRLKDEDYFQYYEPELSVKKAIKKHQLEETFRYRHYLSYDALLQCLELNKLTNCAGIARVEAHYTFLGRFLHPTHDAARGLHVNSNVHSGDTTIGMGQTYSYSAALLSSLYVCFCVASLIDEITQLFDKAPDNFVKDSGTQSLKELVRKVPIEFDYFWFIFNDPPLYDKYTYCIHHATDDELANWGGYAHVPNDKVTFDQNIYGHLQQALNGWSNARCGIYKSPLESHHTK